MALSNQETEELNKIFDCALSVFKTVSLHNVANSNGSSQENVSINSSNSNEDLQRPMKFSKSSLKTLQMSKRIHNEYSHRITESIIKPLERYYKQELQNIEHHYDELNREKVKIEVK